MHKWFVYTQFDDASKAAADFLADRIKISIHKNGVCHVVLPGGNTPAVCLSYLAEKDLPWEKINWYLGDERCYEVGHVDRNDLMLDNNLWSRIGETNIHVIPAEQGADLAAKLYRETIAAIDSFDIVFLGMGEDGHTASLFPDNEALNDDRSVVPVFNSPKAPDERVSLGVETLKNAKTRMVLASGISKASIIKRIRSAEPLPINSIGDIRWYVDEAAISEDNDRK